MNGRNRATTIALTTAIALAAAATGWFAGRSSARTSSAPAVTAPGDGAAAAPSAPTFTCSMHPHVRLDQPGNCPICEMPLIPAAEAPTDGGPPMLQLSEHALAMASVETVSIERRPLTRELRAVGRIDFNESSLTTITPRVDGYAERLFVNFTGIEIREGDHLVEIYSPELLVAQQELLIALQGGVAGALVDVAKTRLRLLGLGEEQITSLIENKQTTDRVTLYSPISGTVIEKNLIEKAAFKAGDVLYRIANLDSVWVYLEVYEYDLAWVRYGQKVEVKAEAIPGRTFEGLVTFVQPIVNDQSRTIRVPVHVENTDHALKPGMFVTATIDAALTHEGRAAPTGIEGRFSCPMHPQVLVDAAGSCPMCGMPLEQIPGGEGEGEAASVAPATARYFCPMKCEGEKTYDDPEQRCPVCSMRLNEVLTSAETHGAGVLAIPVSAVLDSGTRRIAYVEKSRGLFEPRELVLGPRAGAWFSVLAGVEEGERVATRGNFLIDSQFQITGQPSLFYPGGLHASTGHEHAPASGAEAEQAPEAAPVPEHKH